MRYGRAVDRGFLPVFSVGSEEEARKLLVLSCQTNIQNEFIAKELAEEQTVENLFAFGDRLKMMHDKYLKNCTCT